jgi:hypothetical protein
LLPAGSDKLQDVQQGHAVTFAGFPACRFYSIGSAETLEDTVSQYRNYRFKIELIYELAGENKATAEGILEDAMEAVMNAIDADYTLGGNASNATLTSGEIQQVETPYGVTLILTLILNAYTLQQF